MTQKGGSVNYSNFRNRYFEPALKVAGIKKTRIHDLRRTTATVLVANNIDLKTIEVMMGHSDVRLTLSSYTSASNDQKSRASEILAKVFQITSQSN